MAGIAYMSKRPVVGKHHHVVQIKVRSPEVKAVDSRFQREVKALVRKYKPIVRKARMAAEKRMAAKRRKSR